MSRTLYLYYDTEAERTLTTAGVHTAVCRPYSTTGQVRSNFPLVQAACICLAPGVGARGPRGYRNLSTQVLITLQ